MYPLTVDQPYPRNQWRVAAYSAELSRALLARDILGERVLFYRTQSGAPVAVAGICRSYPILPDAYRASKRLRTN